MTINKSTFLILLLILLYLPIQVNAVALGPIDFKSKMFEPLRVHIPVLAKSPAELEQLTYQLIPSNDPYDNHLNDSDIYQYLRLKLRQNDDGSSYIEIKSDFLIKSSMLDFSIEFEWTSGRSSRQYSVLLDPPSNDYEISLAQIKNQPPNQVISVEPDKTIITTVQKNGTLTVTHLADASPKSRPSSQPLARTENGRLVYGPIPRNDSLSNIAKTVNPSLQLTLAQVMLALYEQNPLAFSKNDINRLQAGYTLTIKNPDRIGNVSDSKAVALLSDYTRGNNPSTTKHQQIASVKPISPRHRQLVDKSPDNMTLKQRLLDLKQQNESRATENSFLREKIEQLEQTLPSLQDLLNQKNDQLSNINRQ